MEELKKRNMPAEQPATCLLAEQWTELLALLDAQRRLLTAQSNTMKSLLSTMQTTAAQSEKQTKELLGICQQLQQAGKKNERRLSLPKLHLPTPSPAWLWIIPILVGLLAIWHGWVTVWNTISPLLQLLP